MKVSPINNMQAQFGAKIVNTKDYNNLMLYLRKNVGAPKGMYDTAEDLVLVEKVINAIKDFPTKAELKFSIIHREGELFNARGVVESQYAKYTDTEPARENSNVPIPNIIKRILNPENKAFLNKLMGNENDSVRFAWWENKIKPIWNSVQERFYEYTVYPQNAHPDFDLIFRRNNK